jgi:hypothetical protein
MWPFRDAESKVADLREKLVALDACLARDRDLFERCDCALRLLRQRIPRKEAQRARILAKLRTLAPDAQK